MSSLSPSAVIAITGASSGLGLRFAHVLADAGAAVALMARRSDRLAAEVEAIRARGGRAMAVALDVTRAEAVGPALDAIEAELGPLTGVVNNAGMSGEGAALTLDVEAWDATQSTNVRAAFVVSREAAKRMIASGVAERGEARIVNIASTAAFVFLPGLTAYSASKAALVALTKGLAREWARQQISVNAICPGYIKTDINADWFASDAGKRQVAGFPRRRLMPPDVLDGPLMLLIGSGARFISGTQIVIDDGQSLG